MMTYIHTLHDAPDVTFGKGFLNALHWMLQGHRHSPRKPAGQWRHGPVYVTDARDPSIAAYTAPPAADVPGLTAELIDWLNAADDTPPLIRAAMAHLHLVSIHPWADGNGRMSRSLQTLLIAREGILAPEFSSIEAWLGRPGNTWEYYRELASRGATYQPMQDVSSWVRFNLVAHHQQAQAVRHRINRSGRTWRLLMHYAEQAGLDERVVSALHDVAMSGRARRLRYEHAEGLSLQQAQRDLRDLVSADILEPVGRTRARYYKEGPRFPETALTEARTPMPITSPYPGGLFISLKKKSPARPRPLSSPSTVWACRASTRRVTIYAPFSGSPRLDRAIMTTEVKGSSKGFNLVYTLINEYSFVTGQYAQSVEDTSQQAAPG